MTHREPHSDLAARRARELRRRLTPSELVVWELVRAGRLGVRFRRQEPIGRFIVDFVALAPRVIVEVDGDHHESSPRDALRDGYLAAQGFRILRFWNEDVAHHPEWVADQIRRALAGEATDVDVRDRAGWVE